MLLHDRKVAFPFCQVQGNDLAGSIYLCTLPKHAAIAYLLQTGTKENYRSPPSLGICISPDSFNGDIFFGPAGFP